MSSRSHSPIPKTNKPISKGNSAWKRVNKLAHRLSSKGVPASIVDMIENIHKINPNTIRALNFNQTYSLIEMSSLAKMQSVEALHLNIKYENSLRLKKK